MMSNIRTVARWDTARLRPQQDREAPELQPQEDQETVELQSQ